MSPNHEHECPLCGATYRCYTSHPNYSPMLTCDECLELGDEAGC